eukprot:TRINITY_DN8078_c0_g1_i2.p1 TRINITY_DN8078_c0_g1~~TRINITY_DN8078_c0_g1_i2.p1  ORF type:complete len:215 (-),score=35.35 TRINITY_DN8078_c0_g1_i2:195-839(-)
MDSVYNSDDTLISGSRASDKLRSNLIRRFQHFLDRTTPHSGLRWMFTVFIGLLYMARVFTVKGFYIVTYGLGIYLLNLLIGFLSPQVDPELDGPALPSKGSDEFKPFIRRLPEFKFWYSFTKAIFIALFMTLFPVFDVPVFWPILLLYWVTLFVLTMKRQIRHMIKYKYIPFSFGKQKYKGKKPVAHADDQAEAKSASSTSFSSGAGPSSKAKN